MRVLLRVWHEPNTLSAMTLPARCAPSIPAVGGFRQSRDGREAHSWHWSMTEFPFEAVHFVDCGYLPTVFYQSLAAWDLRRWPDGARTGFDGHRSTTAAMRYRWTSATGGEGGHPPKFQLCHAQRQQPLYCTAVEHSRWRAPSDLAREMPSATPVVYSAQSVEQRCLCQTPRRRCKGPRVNDLQEARQGHPFGTLFAGPAVRVGIRSYSGSSSQQDRAFSRRVWLECCASAASSVSWLQLQTTVEVSKVVSGTSRPQFFWRPQCGCS